MSLEVNGSANDPRFLQGVIHSLNSAIAITTLEGDIVFVNQEWQTFGQQNNGCSNTISGLGLNYLNACIDSASSGDVHAKRALRAFRLVADGTSTLEFVEYPCHSPSQHRWFTMRVTKFEVDFRPFISIMHVDITIRKMAEIRTRELASRDPLTNLYNRRVFDQELGATLCKPEQHEFLTVALVDIDYFKKVNDHYGHSYGDECLRKVSALLGQRFDDEESIVARYGGEEFAILVANEDPGAARKRLDAFVQELAESAIEHKASPLSGQVTVSIGVVTTTGHEHVAAEHFLELADDQLYKAKAAGRNRMCHQVLGDAGDGAART